MWRQSPLVNLTLSAASTKVLLRHWRTFAEIMAVPPPLKWSSGCAGGFCDWRRTSADASDLSATRFSLYHRLPSTVVVQSVLRKGGRSNAVEHGGWRLAVDASPHPSHGIVPSPARLLCPWLLHLPLWHHLWLLPVRVKAGMGWNMHCCCKPCILLLPA